MTNVYEAFFKAFCYYCLSLLACFFVFFVLDCMFTGPHDLLA